MIGYEYHSAAETEYYEAVAFYACISVELGTSFVTEVESAIARARQFPEAYAKIGGALRHVITRRFPYAIIYEVLADRILIWAVAHTSREPNYWRDRL